MSKVILFGPGWEELVEAARFDVQELARLCHMSDRHLRREFRRCLGRPPQGWLNERRMLAARRLLLSGQTIKEVAYQLGYKHTSHFCRQFKSLNAMTPSEFVAARKQAAAMSTQHNDPSAGVNAGALTAVAVFEEVVRGKSQR